MASTLNPGAGPNPPKDTSPEHDLSSGGPEDPDNVDNAPRGAGETLEKAISISPDSDSHPVGQNDNDLAINLSSNDEDAGPPKIVPGPDNWKSTPGSIMGIKWAREDFPAVLYPSIREESAVNPDVKATRWLERHKGYPHVENVYFRASNNYETGGNCYFAAIAALLYGSNSYWPVVKVHHLRWVERVLRDQSHPRHALYNRINQDSSGPTAATALNLWQRLNIPYEWQNSEILQITADLYNLFLVQYEIGSLRPFKVDSVKVRGNYNATHMIIRYVGGNHYQPVIPADMPASEFTFPRITQASTAGSDFVPKRQTGRRTDLGHPWRATYAGFGVPEQLNGTTASVFYDMTQQEFYTITGLKDAEGLSSNTSCPESKPSKPSDNLLETEPVQQTQDSPQKPNTTPPASASGLLSPRLTPQSARRPILPPSTRSSLGNIRIPGLTMNGSTQSPIPGLSLAVTTAGSNPSTPAVVSEARRLSTIAITSALRRTASMLEESASDSSAKRSRLK